jgi:hypothetical protein
MAWLRLTLDSFGKTIPPGSAAQFVKIGHSFTALALAWFGGLLGYGVAAAVRKPLKFAGDDL